MGPKRTIRPAGTNICIFPGTGRWEAKYFAAPPPAAHPAEAGRPGGSNPGPGPAGPGPEQGGKPLGEPPGNPLELREEKYLHFLIKNACQGEWGHI